VRPSRLPPNALRRAMRAKLFLPAESKSLPTDPSAQAQWYRSFAEPFRRVTCSQSTDSSEQLLNS
jgi:hypothetical protein